MSFNFRDEKNAFKDGAKWNFAVDATKDLWREKGTGILPGTMMILDP